MLEKELIKLAGKSVHFNFSLAKISYLQLGGPAKYFITINNRETFLKLVSLLKYYDKKFIVIGKGSNVLINQTTIDPVVLMRGQEQPKLIDENTIEFPASMPLNKAVTFAHKNNLYGLEFLTGIPGSIGGAVVMNAGTPEGEIKNFLHEVEIYRDGNLKIVPTKDLALVYRGSNVKENEFIYSAKFVLPIGDEKTIIAKKKEYQLILKNRKAKQPLNEPSLGSTFKNPLPHFAGKLIEEVGLKGEKIGNVSFSKKHANFIINHGEGKAEDIIKLMELARTKVYQNKNIILEREVKLFGF